MQTRKTFRYWQWRVIVCSMLGYSIFYFVRKNFSFAMPALGAEYGITDTSFGIILTLCGLIYGVSKLVNGFIADRSNPRWHLALGLGICVVLNFLFGWSADLSHMITGQENGPDFINAMVAIMAVLWGFNNIFQGCGFAPCNHLMVNWVPPKELATKMSVWNTGHSIGAGLAAALCGWIIGHMGTDMSANPGIVSRIAGNLGLEPTDATVVAAASHVGAWQWCFWIPALIGVVGVVLVVVSLRDTPSSVGLPELPDTKTEIDDDESKEAFRKFIKEKVLKNKIVWILAITDIFVYIVRFAILDWGPKFLQQGDNHLSPMWAGAMLGLFELFGCLGMLSAGWITDRLFHSRAQRVCAVEMGLTAVCLVVLHLLPAGTSPVLMLFILAMAGFFLYGPQAMLGVTASNQVTKKGASSAVGIIGFMSYLSVLFTGIGIGVLSDNYGEAFWSNLYLIMAGVSVVGGLFVSSLWNIKDDGYIHDDGS